MELKIAHCNINQLKPHARNPRKHNKKQVQQIANSISAFGFVIPVLVDQEFQVIAGHGRLLAAQTLSLETVPVIQIEHLSPAQIQTLMIADNKLTENSEWDKVLLSEHFSELALLELDFTLDVTGFELPEIELFAQALESLEEDETDFASSHLPAQTTRVRSGDLWQLGTHRIYCGDSRNPASYRILMDGKKANIVFADPPYNVKIDGHVSGRGEVQHREFAMAAGEMTADGFQSFLEQAISNLAANTDDGSIHYICMDWRHALELQLAAKKHYSELKNICVWEKDNGGMGSLYRSQHEFIFVYKNGSQPHINNVQLGKYGRNRTNIWHYGGMNSFSREKEDEGNLIDLHPTVKPVPLIADALRDCSNKGDIVLDNFLGSGSTLIAAEKTERICFGIEIDPHYVEAIICRWEKLTGRKAAQIIPDLTSI